MVINALNSGAQVYMADFEDSMRPLHGTIEGQIKPAATPWPGHRITAGEKHYRLNPTVATLMVRRAAASSSSGT